MVLRFKAQWMVRLHNSSDISVAHSTKPVQSVQEVEKYGWYNGSCSATDLNIYELEMRFGLLIRVQISFDIFQESIYFFNLRNNYLVLPSTASSLSNQIRGSGGTTLFEWKSIAL